jgi:hypothetical protein
MTVTTLAEIEACPRRWSLGTAQYPDLWSGRGYPPRVQQSALAGIVVHLTLEAITSELVRAGCLSVQDPIAPKVLKNLGGYTKVVNDRIDRVLERLANSPRATRILEFAARALRAQVPELRARTQTMLCRVRLPQSVRSQIDSRTSKARRPITQGAFPEIELRAAQIGWKGKADLVVLSPSTCEIIDFKTGEPDEAHRFQLQIYALLWSRDEELNPSRRLADRLISIYGDASVEIAAPTAAQLDDLEREIVARQHAACQALSQRPPEARPSGANCRYCGVRQLCTEYWLADTQREIATQIGDRRFTDLEVTIAGRHGPSSWDAVAGLSRDVPPGAPVLLRMAENTQLRPGDRLRVLDAAITLDAADENQPAVITLGVHGETYLVA